MSVRYPQAYIDFLAHFHGDRDYFECHELLEEFWKQHPDSVDRQTWAGLIQAAVGMYHYRRGNIPGALKSFVNSLRNSDEESLRELGIDAELWKRRLEEVRLKLLSPPSYPYEDIEIPLTDPVLLHMCEERCKELGAAWLSPSDLHNEQLVHRHTLRDRTEVIAERRKAWERRNGGR